MQYNSAQATLNSPFSTLKFFNHLETGTLFDPLPRVNNSIIIGVRTQVPMTDHLCIRITLQQFAHQAMQRFFLVGSTRIRCLSVLIQSPS